MPIDPSARVWPFGYSQVSPVSVERSYKTSIFGSEAGREQRRALRDRPRKTIRFTLVVADDCYRETMRELHRYQGVLFALPDWTRKRLTTTVFAGAGTSLDVDSVENWMVVGENVIVALQGRFELYTINDVTGSTLTFDESNAGADFPIGSRVYAAVPAWLGQTLSGFRPAGFRDLWSVEVVFEVLPTEEFYIEPPVAPVTFNGREVLSKPPHRIENIDHAIIAGIDEVDVGFGPKARFQPITFPTERYALTYTGCNRDKTEELEDIFVRARGRRGEFYMPTWENDLVPNATAGSGTTSLVVEGDDAANAYGGSTAFKALAVHFTDNTVEYNTVTNVSPASGVSTLTVGTAWSRDIDPALIRYISWMPVCRFAADLLTTEWFRTPDVDGLTGRMRLPIQTLEDLP